LECPNNADTLKNKHDEFGADSNDYKNIPLNIVRFAQANAEFTRLSGGTIGYKKRGSRTRYFFRLSLF
jgi:hypothetical protein